MDNKPRVVKKRSFHTTVYNFTISHYLQLFERGELDVNAPFQRGWVWNEEQKSKLIDSVFHGRGIGSLGMHYRSKSMGAIEVIDGKQRIGALYDFWKNKFPYKCETYPDGVYYKDLHDRDQKFFRIGFTIPQMTAENLDDVQRYEFFLFLNETGVEHDLDHLRDVRERYHELKEERKRKTGDCQYCGLREDLVLCQRCGIYVCRLDCYLGNAGCSRCEDVKDEFLKETFLNVL